MRVLILSTCTVSKTLHHPRQLTGDDFEAGLVHIRRRMKELPLIRAADLYNGPAYCRLYSMVQYLRRRGVTVEQKILSCPGYGLIDSEQMIAPYDYAWASGGRHDRVRIWSSEEIRTWSDKRGVSAKIHQWLSQPYDLAILVLSRKYFDACGFTPDTKLGGPTLLAGLRATDAAKLLASLPRNPNVRHFPFGTKLWQTNHMSRPVAVASVILYAMMHGLEDNPPWSFKQFVKTMQAIERQEERELGKPQTRPWGGARLWKRLAELGID